METPINNMIFRLIGTLLVVFVLSSQYNLAQEKNDSLPDSGDKIKPLLKLNISKNNDGTRTLSSLFSYRNKQTKEIVKVKGIRMDFYTGSDSLIKIGAFETDEDGKISFTLPDNYKYSRNKDGFIHFELDFKGNDQFEAGSSEVDIIDIQLKLSLEIIDSVKTIKVEALKVLGDNKTEAVKDETIPVFVERMFGHLKIGDISLTDGEGSLEFPSDIPGDTIGQLTIIAKFDENETYGTVEKRETRNWGITTFHHTVYHPRSLWTAIAPVWMIVTLSIMLFGVWGHYIYVIIQLIRLKRIKKDKPEAEIQ